MKKSVLSKFLSIVVCGTIVLSVSGCKSNGEANLDNNVDDIPSVSVETLKEDYELIKFSDNVHYVLDYAKDFWRGYIPLDEGDNTEEYTLVDEEINNYLLEAQEYANSTTESIVCYICVSDKVYNTADAVIENLGEAGIPESTESYIKGSEQEVVGFEIHMARFTSDDSNIDELSKAIVYYMRHPETYAGNGGIFDRNELLIEHNPGDIAEFYDKTVNETGKLLRNYYDTKTGKLVITARLYPGQI